jgi:serine/threonine-protein kinase
MSPEQAAGKRGDELDGRSDIYSLGIVMYQMLTRELPYKADTTMGMLLAHMQIPPIPIQTLCPDLQIPEPIANVVMRCLEKDRDLRPASAKALIEELERAQKEKVITLAATGPARPGEALFDQSPWTPARRPAPTEPSQPRHAASPAHPLEPLPASSPRWGVWASTAIAVVVLAIGGWYFGRGSSGTPTAQPETAPPQSLGAPASPTVTAARPRPEENTGESRIGPAATVASASVAPRSNSLEIEKQVKGAVTEGDFHYENGEYGEAIKSYQEGLKLDRANVELRRKIQRAQKAKATEGAVKR